MAIGDNAKNLLMISVGSMNGTVLGRSSCIAAQCGYDVAE